jgi:hypothetical protein
MSVILSAAHVVLAISISIYLFVSGHNLFEDSIPGSWLALIWVNALSSAAVCLIVRHTISKRNIKQPTRFRQQEFHIKRLREIAWLHKIANLLAVCFFIPSVVVASLMFALDDSLDQIILLVVVLGIYSVIAVAIGIFILLEKRRD